MKTQPKLVFVNGRAVTIRPICSTDTQIESDFVRHLSAETKHFRFFGALNELSAEEARHFCDVDGNNSMAFVALIRQGDLDVEIGVCRYAPGEKPDSRELAITIADEWQHSVLPTILLQSLVEAAKQFGIHELFAIELVDNRIMHDFALANGMSAKHNLVEPGQVVYSLPLS